MKLKHIATIFLLASGLAATRAQEVKLNIPGQKDQPASAAAATPAKAAFTDEQLIEEFGWFIGKRVGLLPEGKAPARAHTEIANDEGREIGEVTSGGFGPSLGKPIAMGYVATASAALGSAVNLVVRGKALPARVAKMPFTPHRYHRN